MVNDKKRLVIPLQGPDDWRGAERIARMINLPTAGFEFLNIHSGNVNERLIATHGAFVEESPPSMTAELQTFDSHEFRLVSSTLGHCICGRVFAEYDMAGSPEENAERVGEAYRSHISDKGRP
jgi:hypothetical protein